MYGKWPAAGGGEGGGDGCCGSKVGGGDGDGDKVSVHG